MYFAAKLYRKTLSIIAMIGLKPNFKKAIVYIYRGDLFMLEYRQKQPHPIL